MAFEFVAEVLERETYFDRLQARGTVRLALRELGIEARSVTPAQMVTVIKRRLPHELETRGIKNGDTLCRLICAGVLHLDGSSTNTEAFDSSSSHENLEQPR